MHLSLIQEGEELEKKATDEKLDDLTRSNANLTLYFFLRTHAKDLLEAAKYALEHGYENS